MIAVDTNLLVRWFTEDDARQAERAMKRVDSDLVFVPKTVLLETEWVLRSTYGFSARKIVRSFGMLLGHPNVTVEDPDSVDRAMSWYPQRLSFADALHLASSRQAQAFVTFDEPMRKQASGLPGAIPVVAP